MGGVKKRFERALALMVLSGAANAALADCTVGKVADLSVTMEDMQPITYVQINGVEKPFVVDSGSFYSVISPGSARALGLHNDPLPGWMLKGINGDTPMGVTTVKKFGIAGATIPNISFVVAGSEVGATGVLGQNILNLFEVEYDLPHGMIRLIEAKGCAKTNLAYWAVNRPVSILPIAVPDQNNPHTIGTVLLNGVKIRAMFDTGASNSLLSMAAAARAGITPHSPGVEPGGNIVGFGRNLVRTWIAPFDSFKVGDQEEIKHGRIRFGEVTDNTEMLIGADFLIAHRVFVDNSAHRLFLTYEGGPVFNLKAEHHDETGAKSTDVTASEAPTSAEGYSRSGAVLMAQNDIKGAIVDFDKAVEMAPSEPRYLLQRANALIDADQRDAAKADVEKVLSTAPHNVDALMLRARFKLNDDGSGDPAIAVDLDAVDRAAAPAADERLILARLYTQAALPARAIPQFDLWIRNHPDDVRRPEALNGRCWARALAGIDLPAALSDCNAALRQRPGGTSILDSRAMVELRMGDLDKAIRDYDAVIAKQPNAAWSLYGRGIAKQRKGDAAGGKADLEASAKTAPKLADRAKALGITP